MIQIKTQNKSLEVNTDILDKINKAFNNALDRFHHRIREAEVILSDLNGPRGGIDKRCTVQVRMLPRGILVVRSTGSSLLEAANDACDKLKSVIGKRLTKRRGA